MWHYPTLAWFGGSEIHVWDMSGTQVSIKFHHASSGRSIKWCAKSMCTRGVVSLGTLSWCEHFHLDCICTCIVLFITRKMIIIMRGKPSSHERDMREGGRRERERKRQRERERERERDHIVEDRAILTHSVSESDSPTTDRFLCGRGSVFGYCSLIKTDHDLFVCSRLLGLFFKGLLLCVYGGLSMLCYDRPSSIATLLTGEPSCF